jgi:hypothetical protein
MGISHRDKGILGHDDHGVGTSNLLHGLKHGLFESLFHGLGHKMQHDFRIHARLENGSIIFQFCSNLSRIHEIAVMGDGQCLSRVLDPEGLRIYE